MTTTKALTTLLAVSALSAGAAAGTAGALDGDTTSTVGPPKQLVAGATAPFDAPGVKAIRQGKAIPAGYVLVGRTVATKAGRGSAGAAIRLSCPSGKVLQTLGATGRTGLQLTQKYLGRSATNVMSLDGRGSTSGTVYGVCR